MTLNTVPESHMPGPEIEAYVLLKQVNSMLEIFNRYDLRGEGLTVPQFAILNHATSEGVPLSEISTRMLCDNSNLTGIVDRLISKGLVERRPDPQDRRVSLICLTQEGADKLRSIRPRHHASVMRRMHTLSQHEVQQLRDLLQNLYSGLETVLEDTRSVAPSSEARPSNGVSQNGHGQRLAEAPAPVHRPSVRTSSNGASASPSAHTMHSSDGSSCSFS
jgi:DNA-binding MarR family transcriptional regulator